MIRGSQWGREVDIWEVRMTSWRGRRGGEGGQVQQGSLQGKYKMWKDLERGVVSWMTCNSALTEELKAAQKNVVNVRTL